APRRRVPRCTRFRAEPRRRLPRASLRTELAGPRSDLPGEAEAGDLESVEARASYERTAERARGNLSTLALLQRALLRDPGGDLDVPSTPQVLELAAIAPSPVPQGAMLIVLLLHHVLIEQNDGS